MYPCSKSAEMSLTGLLAIPWDRISVFFYGFKTVKKIKLRFWRDLEKVLYVSKPYFFYGFGDLKKVLYVSKPQNCGLTIQTCHFSKAIATFGCENLKIFACGAHKCHVSNRFWFFIIRGSNKKRSNTIIRSALNVSGGGSPEGRKIVGAFLDKKISVLWQSKQNTASLYQ